MRTISATGNEPTRTARAFTLIELSIVVFILALILAVCAPQFVRSYNTTVLNETVRVFTTMSQLARMQAVTQQQKAILHVDVDRQAFWVTQLLKDENGDLVETSIKAFTCSSRVTLVSAERPETGQAEKLVEATFYPNGTCDQITVLFRGVEKNGLAASLDPITCKAIAYPVK